MCAEDCSINFEKLVNRIKYCLNWKGYTNPFEMAYAGFYFTGTEYVCVCFYCGIEIYEWGHSMTHWMST